MVNNRRGGNDNTPINERIEIKDKYVINENDDDLYNVVKLSSEYDKCSFIGKLIYLWKWRFFLKHYKKDIKLKDIPKGRKIDESNYIYNEFLNYWNAEVIRAKKNKRHPNLLYPIFHQYGFQIIFFGLIVFITFYLVFLQALFLEDLIKYFNEFNEDNKNSKKGIILVSVVITLCSFFTAITGTIFNNYLDLISIRVRVCLSEFIYRKSLLLSKSGLDNTSAGQIVNLLSIDMTRIDSVFSMLPFPFVGISLLIYAIYKLWKYLSYFTFYGVLFLFVVLPIQILIGTVYSRMRMKAADYTDERIRLVDEFLNAIKVIKFYCFELSFSKKIEEARKKEVDIMRRSLYIYSVSIGLLTSTTKMIVYIILVVFYFSGGLITDRIVFLTLSVFTQVTFLITVFIPHFISTSSNLWIAIKRLNKFLRLEEREQLKNGTGSLFINTVDKSIEENVEYVNGNPNTSTKKIFDLSVKNMTACYSSVEGLDNPNFFDEDDKSSEESIKLFNVLKNINFDCKPGELIIVVGAVGSGKSSLLQAILSELKISEGSIEMNGKVSYSCQEPWTFAGTVKENILFDSEYDEEKYNEIIKVCALERDLALFSDGDDTFIGEKGVALSGGQKARINLARSLYFNADIYLLDDSLSAVDAHVSKHIFKQAISDFLKHKTVILVTHQLNYLKYADKILFIKDGEQIFFDLGKNAMKKLIEESDSEFTKFIGSGVENQTKQYSRTLQDSSETLLSIAQSLVSKKNSLSLDTSEPNYYDERSEFDQLKELKKIEKENRLQEEDDKVLFVHKAYLSYFKHGKIGLFGPLVLFVFILSQVFASSSDYMLKMWSDSVKVSEFSNSINQTSKSSDVELSPIKKFIYENNVYCYSGLICCFFFVSLIRTVIFSMFGMRASVNIHKYLFERIVRAKMIFFYSNPIGIILNRFSRDIGIVDNDLISSFHDFLEIMITSIIIFVVMVITASPFLIIPFLVFIIFVIIFRNFYIHTARSLETLEGVSKSPVIQHLTSTLNGLSTIRAFKREDKFIKKFQSAQNDHTSVHFASHSSKRMFNYMLDNFQIIFVGGCLLIMTILAELFTGSLIGLLTNYILQFSAEFQWCVICWANLETYLCSVDRIEKMGKNFGISKENLSEPPLESAPDCKPPSNWPKNPRIVFNNVTMSYFKGEEPVLKNLNFTIEEKDKIGIVGRTGAGKSSIVSALFRLTDYEGDIIIDGINCKSIGLHDLRGKISIIPQEPVLFNGTIRSNLDPLNQFKDDKLWNALKATQLEQVVKELEGGLEAKVTDNGGNFSVGQKQLICLARAILKENKILVIDEATANCDLKTDDLIQTTIRNVFKHCAILTIAHRLNTIMDSTKILVLDAGELQEFDTPLKLLKNETSLFTNMVYANGDEQAKNLIKIAEEAEKYFGNLN